MAKRYARRKATAKRRPSMGADPLDALFSAPAQRAMKASGGHLARATDGKGRAPKPERPRKPPKVRATFHLPADLFEKCRDAVVALSGPPVRLTLAHMAEEALRRELARMAKAHHKGKDFPRRSGELKGGRPIGS